eukprot:185162-Prorocentrum_minimum.AAC.1
MGEQIDMCVSLVGSSLNVLMRALEDFEHWRDMVTSQHVLPTNVLSYLTVIASQGSQRPRPIDEISLYSFTCWHDPSELRKYETYHMYVEPELTLYPVSLYPQEAGFRALSSCRMVLRGKTTLAERIADLRNACSAAAPKKLIR